MGSIPQLLLHDATTNDEFESYFRELENSLSRWDTVRGRQLRLTDVDKVDNEVKDEDFLKFVTLNYRDFKVIGLFQAENNYFHGFLTTEKVSNGSRPRTCYIITQDIQKNAKIINAIKRCVNENYGSEITCKDAKLGESYPILEKIAGLRRSQIWLGRQALIEAIIFLSTADEKSLLRDMAKHCIVITQMFCESFRCRKLAEYRLDKFVTGFFPPEDLLLGEHGWSTASRSLQSQSDANNYNLHVADVREDALSDDDLHQMYDLLLRFSGGEVKEAPTKDFDKVLTIKYLYACLQNQKYMKSRRLEFKSTEEVTVVVHIFSEYMVLQYNHLQLSKHIKDLHVDVEVLPCDSLSKAEDQPLQDIQGRTFVTFKRLKNVPGLTFSSNWHHKDVDTNKLPSLNDFQLPCQDYFHKDPTKKFYEAQEDLKLRKKYACLHFSHHTLYKGMKLDDAKTRLEEIFGMELGDDQVNKTITLEEERPIGEKEPSKNKKGARPRKNRKLTRALYLTKFHVFLTVLFNMSEEKVVQYPHVQIVCEKECRNAIAEIFKDWQEDECKCTHTKS